MTSHPGQPSDVPIDWLDVLPPQADCLRDYQRQQLGELASALHEGSGRILVQLPTGGGKTHLIAAIVTAATLAGLRVLILATRTRLVRQIHERLQAFECSHGVIAASLPDLRNYSAQVQVASVDTLHRRAVVNEHIPLPPAELVLFDEGHLATAKTRLCILESYPRALRVGFTATPARKSGQSLGAAFDRLIVGPSIRELTAAGTLVPCRIFNTPSVTQDELQTLPKDVDRDYATGALSELFRRPKLVGDVVGNWMRIAPGKRTLVFTVNKAHAAALLAEFLRQGVAAEMLTDADDEATREEVIGRLERGDTRVVLNCFLMSYGVDIPQLEAIVLARPTRSLAMYLQMVGRGLRPAPGKDGCIVIDHGRVIETLGLPQSDYPWTLDASRNVNAEVMHPEGKSQVEQTRECSQCQALWLTSEQGCACPNCGWMAPVKSREIEVQDADLQELADEPEKRQPHDRQVTEFFREACGWYARRWPDRWQQKPNGGRYWAWLQTCARFKLPDSVRMPRNNWQADPAPSSMETHGWLQHRLIKYAKSRARRAA